MNTPALNGLYIIPSLVFSMVLKKTNSIPDIENLIQRTNNRGVISRLSTSAYCTTASFNAAVARVEALDHVEM